MNKNYYVYEMNSKQASALKKALIQKGYELDDAEHALFQTKRDKLTVILYKSLKLVVQGKNTEEFVRYFLEPEILKEAVFGYEGILEEEKGLDAIGVDECGKGDYFGPLVAAAVFVPKKSIKDLIDAGVRDSKKLSPKKIDTLSAMIRNLCPMHVVAIGPERYNSMYAKLKNLNRLLAWAHATAIKNLYQAINCARVVVDQFADESLVINALGSELVNKLELVQRHHAESDVAVAAASIIARSEFLKRIKNLGQLYHQELPLGAGPAVDACAKAILEKQGITMLSKIAKMHFKTTEKIRAKD
ncbi:MAG: ribonuclease HIII [Chlamydiota bacterium]|nr:ribonuclease HIII [Chlamydiota bacterium]